MPDEFPYNVFLSHSAKDKAVVRPLAERLRQDRLNRRPSELQPLSFFLHTFFRAPLNKELRSMRFHCD